MLVVVWSMHVSLNLMTQLHRDIEGQGYRKQTYCYDDHYQL